ncbi:hypothetical protein QOZ80_2BG0203560 [Eleusine coracana subsp. coracana]|nr:hypothetical protein QOZ80_2BG0203560 [Eleusine coracana subsp. coracana]
MPREGDGSDEVADLWAMAAELERQFAGYKQRLAERNGGVSAHVDDDACDDEEAEEEAEPYGGDGDVRGRMYEAYVRRRDERLRQGWRQRMERKEAEVKAFWAQLELSSGRAGGGGGERAPVLAGSTTDDAGTTAAGDQEGETERNDDDDKRRSSDAALAQKRITGKKHARTRSFSSSTNTAGRNRPDVVGRRRAVSQEPPPSEPQQPAGETSKESRARPAGGAATTKTTASRPRTALRRKNSVKVHHQHGGAKQAGPKLLPRSLPRRASSGGLEDDLGSREADALAPVLRRSSYEQDSHGETPKVSSPARPSVGGGGGTGSANAQSDSTGSDRSEVVDAVPDREPKAKNVNVQKRGEDEVDACSPDKLGNPNGDITSDSDIESSYVYINKHVVGKHATSVPGEPHAAPGFSLKKTNEDDAETTTAPAGGAAATEIIATTRKSAEEAPPARESSGESSFSGSGIRLGRSHSPPSSAAPSCSSRDHSIERVLEADAALLRKKREKQRAEKSAVKTPGSAGSGGSAGTARSPKETPKGFKRFLSFGKKNRGREVTVIDCTSPSVSSVADDDCGGWQSAGSIKPRMASSDAASDDTDHIGHATSPRACSLQSLVAASPAKSELAEIVPQVKSPKAQQSFFSFRTLNCGRG